MLMHLEALRIISSGRPKSGLVCGQDTLYICDLCHKVFAQWGNGRVWRCWSCWWRQNRPGARLACSVAGKEPRRTRVCGGRLMRSINARRGPLEGKRGS